MIDSHDHLVTRPSKITQMVAICVSRHMYVIAETTHCLASCACAVCFSNEDSDFQRFPLLPPATAALVLLGHTVHHIPNIS